MYSNPHACHICACKPIFTSDIIAQCTFDTTLINALNIIFISFNLLGMVIANAYASFIYAFPVSLSTSGLQ